MLATSQPRVIYLFMPPFYYAFVSSACTRRLFSPPPSPPFELFDRWGVANGLLIFFFLAKKMFKLKKFRFDTSTRWFREDSIESFVCLVAFCFTIHGNVIWNFEFESRRNFSMYLWIDLYFIYTKFWEFETAITTVFLSFFLFRLKQFYLRWEWLFVNFCRMFSAVSDSLN